MNIIISVIITTHNRDDFFLRRAISSVLSQTYMNYELIVVDDNGPNNKFQEIVGKTVKSFNSIKEILLIQHEENSGANVARNTGIHHAKGEYIAFLDDDDEWLERKLELQLDKFQQTEHNNLGLVYCWFNKYIELEDKRVIKKVFKPHSTPSKVHKNLLRNNFIGSTSFPLIKRECFNTVGYFDEGLEAKEDYDMWMRLSKAYEMDYVALPLCNYYAHTQDRITNNKTKKLKAEIVFLDKHFDDIKVDKRALAIKYRLIANYYIYFNDYRSSRAYIWKAIKLKPHYYKLYILLFLTVVNPKSIGVTK